MKTKNNISTARRFRGGLKKKRDLHFRVDDHEYEWLARVSYGSSISEQTRKRWFKDYSPTSLDLLRRNQRDMGIPDFQFIHPQKRREMNGTKHV